LTRIKATSQSYYLMNVGAPFDVCQVFYTWSIS
jgi:hypothetical protein